VEVCVGGFSSVSGQEGTRNNIPQGPTPVTCFLHSVLPSEVSMTSQNSATDWGPSVQHISLWQTFQIQPITVPQCHMLKLESLTSFIFYIHFWG
jgi:hypothetical protein